MDDNSFSPARISARFIQVGCKKANSSPLRLMLVSAAIPNTLQEVAKAT